MMMIKQLQLQPPPTVPTLSQLPFPVYLPLSPPTSPPSSSSSWERQCPMLELRLHMVHQRLKMETVRVDWGHDGYDVVVDEGIGDGAVVVVVAVGEGGCGVVVVVCTRATDVSSLMAGVVIHDYNCHYHRDDGDADDLYTPDTWSDNIQKTGSVVLVVAAVVADDVYQTVVNGAKGMYLVAMLSMKLIKQHWML